MTTTIGNNNDDSNKAKVNGHNEDIESARKPDSGDSVGGKVSSEESATRVNRNRPLRVWLRRVAVMLIIGGILAALAAVVYIYLGWLSLVQILIVAIVAWLASGKYRWFIVAAKTAPRDVRSLYGFIRLLLQIRGYSTKNMTLADIFQQNVRKHPNKICVLYENEKWTFQQIEDYSNKVANVFKSHGYKRGDVVALYMENKPEYIATWIGLSKLGVIVPLINTNLRQSSLVHSITIAKSQAVVFASELSSGIDEILEKIESKVALYHVAFPNANSNTIDQRYKNLNELLKEASPTPPVLNEKINYHDHMVYIYTSGTTGLPKAAVITNARYIFIASAIHWLARFRPSDRFYVPLPLYHTAGGCMSVGQMLIFGASLVVRKKFSASQYFPDCKKYECTVSQYIGEMARYVLAVPKTEADSDHKLRLIFGNGMRPQIWTEFVDRFKIPRVAEFYGATEGNANIVNVDNTIGAIGFVSRIIPQVYPISIIRVDPQTGDPIRNAKGLCQLCKPDEPGVFIGKIVPGNPSRAFLGYVDKEASKKKVVYDVFTKGDSAFLSGDILVADELGNLFFKDRTGDTFRWKGENVSTSEVDAVLSNITAYKDVVVYGVEVRGQEGRAGMAAILDPEGSLDFKALADGVRKELPTYARPIFIRTMTKMDMTGTYKLKKNDLQDEAYDVNKISDNVHYLDGSGQYKLLTKELLDRINDGSIRL